MRPDAVAPGPPQRHILVVDDDPGVLEMYADLLTGEGYRVTAEPMPYVDIADMLPVGPDLVVLDLLVGHRDCGTTFLEMLKTNPATRHLPVLVCSAAHDHLVRLEDRLRAWDCTVVAKPFLVDVFLAVVASCMDAGPTRRAV